MYLEIIPPPDCDKFSFLLFKNPASPPYVRDLSASDDGSRVVTGKYVNTAYMITVENDALKLVARLRAENKASYVSSIPYAVNPRNLKCAGYALKSVLDGKIGEPVTPEDAARPHAFAAKIGPFCCSAQEVHRIFETVGLTVEVPHDGAARVVTLRREAPLTEFLQRVFLGAYALTARDNEQKLYVDSLVDSLIEMGRGWLGKCPEADLVISRLAGYRKSVAARIRTEVGDAEESTRPATEDPERKIRLHDRRHATILASLQGQVPRRIVDLGCGDGSLTAQLLEAFPDAEVVGVEAGERIQRAVRKHRNRVRLIHDNLMALYLEKADLEPDVMVMSEVIEHLIADDRELVMRQIARMWRPQLFVLTTPNIEYNPVFGMPAGVLRHWDHKIEYTAEDLRREVIQPLEDGGYSVFVAPVQGCEHEDLQPSFVVLAVRGELRRPTDRYLRQSREAGAPVILEEVGAVIPAGSVRDGLRHPVYRNFRQTAFYLSPTMAPVEHDPTHPDYLEHPAAAFAYYRQRGETVLIEQHKYMGSRCHLLVFRDEQVARQVGQPPVVAVSRGGYPFFSDDPAQHFAAIRPQIRFDDGVDFVVLDTEALPWSHKAGGDRGLIIREFQAPGEAARLHAQLLGKPTENADKFLEALSWFAGDGPLEHRVFDVIGWGAVRDGKYQPHFTFHSTYQMRLAWMRGHILEDEGDRIKMAASRTVCIDDDLSCRMSIQRWMHYTTDLKGEGFVYKPASINPGLQPALKVRGRDYLRIIYGIDYLEPEIFRMLTNRKVSGKRRVALLEASLGRRIAQCYFRGLSSEHARCVAAFLGADGEAKAQIDATL